MKRFQFYIPEELMKQILLKLPVKSLIRFKSVCKSWNSLINDPKFINEHLQINLSSKNNSSMLLGYARLDEPHSVIRKNVLSLATNNNNTEFYFPNIRRIVQVFFYNPALRDLRSLRYPIANYKRGYMYLNYGCGFGYDPKTNDYKFIILSRSMYDITAPFRALVCTLGTDQWRELEFKLDDDGDKKVVHRLWLRCGVYLNGRYYWKNYANNNKTILSFDISTETFESIGLPRRRGLLESIYTLATWRGSLVCFVNEDSTCLEMWVLMDGGDWTRHRTIRPDLAVDMVWNFWKDDVVFMLLKTGKVVTCNISDGKLKELPNSEVALPWTTFMASLYVESLVSVKQ